MKSKIRVGLLKFKGGSLGRYYNSLKHSLKNENRIDLKSIEAKWNYWDPFCSIKHPMKTNNIIEMVEKIDLDVLHCPHELVPAFFWLISDVKKVITIHGAAPHYVGDLINPDGVPFSRKVRKYTLRYLQRHIDGLITLSESMKHGIAEWYKINKSSINVIHPAIDCEAFMRNPPETRDDTNKEKTDQDYFIWFSSCRPVKNLPKLVSALQTARKQEPGIKLAIAGPSRQKVLSGLPEELHGATKEGLIFLGHLNGQKLASVVSGALGTVIPSLYEGFGLPIAESFFCETPVIASRVGGIPEAGGNAVYYIEDPTSETEIARALLQFYKDDDMRTKYKQRAKNRASNFTLARLGSEMSQFYSKKTL